MRPLEMPLTELSGTPARVTVTDYVVRARPQPGRAIGETWFSTDVGDSRAYVHVVGEGLEQSLFFSDQAETTVPNLPFDLRLRMGLAEYFGSLRVAAPVFESRSLLGVKGHRYLCVMCARPHFLTTHSIHTLRPRTGHKPLCRGLMGLDDTQLPTVEPGEPIDLAAYEAGALTLRMSRLISKTTQGESR